MASNLQQTQIVKTPKDWEVLELNSVIVESFSGEWGHENREENTIQCSIIRGTDFPMVKRNIISKIPKRYILISKLGKKIMKQGDFLIEISGGSVDQPTGRILFVNETVRAESIFFSNFVKLIRIDARKVFSHYFFWFWEYLYLLGRTKLFENRTVNIRNFKINEFLKLNCINCPPLPEQIKIAEILSTVDEAIEKVDKAIEKTERLKKGLMQKLLTKGIGHKEFKETEIGRIPREWEVVRLGDIALDFISGGTPSTKNSAYWDGPIPWMTSAHINGKTIVDGMQNITEAGVKNSATNIVPVNSILMATRVGIGKVAINLTDIAISQDLTGIVLDKKKIDVEYAYWLLSSLTVKLVNLSQGSTIKGLLRDNIERIEIPLPSILEQKKIVEILNNLDIRLDLLEDKKQKFGKIKRALMNDLLTGKKRVRV